MNEDIKDVAKIKKWHGKNYIIKGPSGQIRLPLRGISLKRLMFGYGNETDFSIFFV
jgi:hypothetical protein